MSLRLTDLLALTWVPRWVNVPMMRQQSVGEHTFRVIVIYYELVMRLKLNIAAVELLAALTHDAAECWSGDIPKPFKREMQAIAGEQSVSEHESAAWNMLPWLRKEADIPAWSSQLLTIADLIEALTWVRKFGIGAHAQRCQIAMRRQLNGAVTEFVGEHFNRGLHGEIDPLQVERIESVIHDIEDEEGRFGGRATASQ